MKKSKLTLTLLSIGLLAACEPTEDLSSVLASYVSSTEESSTTASSVEEVSSSEEVSSVLESSVVEESSSIESSVIEDSSSVDDRKDSSSTVITPLPAGNVTKTGNLIVDSVLPIGLNSQGSYLDMDVAYHYYQNDQGYPVGDNWVFNGQPLKKINGVVDATTTKGNYQALANIFSMDQLATLLSAFSSDAPSLELPPAYLMAGNHFRKMAEKTSFSDEEEIAVAQLEDNFVFADYANLNTDNEKYYAYASTSLTQVEDEEIPVVTTSRRHALNEGESEEVTEEEEVTLDIFSLLEGLLASTGISQEDVEGIVNLLTQIYEVVDDGIDMNINKKSVKGVTDYQYDISLNEDGVKQVNNFITETLGLPDGITLGVAEIEGQKSTIQPLHIVADYSKDKEGHINVDYINFDFGLALTIKSGFFSIPVNFAISMDLNFDQQLVALDENYFTTLADKFDGIEEDYQIAQEYYEKGRAYCVPATTDISKAGLAEYDAYVASYLDLSDRVKQILADSMSYDLVDGLTIQYNGNEVLLNDMIQTAKDTLAKVVNNWKDTSTFTESNIAKTLGTSKSGLASYKNYLVALQESDKGESIMTALNTFLASYLEEKNTTLTTYQSDLDALKTDYLSVDNATAMVSDYKTACSITLLDEVYFTDEYIAGYQLLESNLEQYLDDTIVEYANHIQALMDEEELDIEKLALDLDNNYETITSAPSGLFNTFTTDSTRVNTFKLTIGYLDLSNFYITLQDKADAYYTEYETQLNSITTAEDWATLKKTINKTISYLNIIETNLYNSADLSADLVSLVATGDQKTF